MQLEKNITGSYINSHSNYMNSFVIHSKLWHSIKLKQNKINEQHSHLKCTTEYTNIYVYVLVFVHNLNIGLFLLTSKVCQRTMYSEHTFSIQLHIISMNITFTISTVCRSTKWLMIFSAHMLCDESQFAHFINEILTHSHSEACREQKKKKNNRRAVLFARYLL